MKVKVFQTVMFMFNICLLITLIAGCSSSTNVNLKEQKEKTDQTTFISKTVNNLNIKINKIATSENAKGDQNMVEINMTILNKDAGELGIGANDFKIKSGGKRYEVYPQANNFGDEIKPEGKLIGSAFFEIPKYIKEAELVYEINQKEVATWKLSIPKAK